MVDSGHSNLRWGLSLVHHILGQKQGSSKERQAYSLHFAPVSFFAGQGTVARRLRMKFRFPIIIIDEDYRSENTSASVSARLAQAIESEGFEVVGVTSYGDLSQLHSSRARRAPSFCPSMTKSSR